MYLSLDIRVYVSQCPWCEFEYIYSEFDEGIFNYDNKILLSLRFCTHLRYGLKVFHLKLAYKGLKVSSYICRKLTEFSTVQYCRFTEKYFQARKKFIIGHLAFFFRIPILVMKGHIRKSHRFLNFFIFHWKNIWSTRTMEKIRISPLSPFHYVFKCYINTVEQNRKVAVTMIIKYKHKYFYIKWKLYLNN